MAAAVSLYTYLLGLISLSFVYTYYSIYYNSFVERDTYRTIEQLRLEAKKLRDEIIGQKQLLENCELNKRDACEFSQRTSSSGRDLNTSSTEKFVPGAILLAATAYITWKYFLVPDNRQPVELMVLSPANAYQLSLDLDCKAQICRIANNSACDILMTGARITCGKPSNCRTEEYLFPEDFLLVAGSDIEVNAGKSYKPPKRARTRNSDSSQVSVTYLDSRCHKELQWTKRAIWKSGTETILWDKNSFRILNEYINS